MIFGLCKFCANAYLHHSMTASISIYHDTRRGKGSNVFPVKLRVYFNYQTRFYRTGIDLSIDDYQRSYLSQKPRQEFKEIKEKICSIEARANHIKQSLSTFSFDNFEKKLLRPTGSGADVIYSYNELIKQLEEEDRINTAASYRCSLASIKEFLKLKGWNDSKLAFEKVTEKFLEEYERWMLGAGNSRTTVGIYTRALRAIFNSAIADEEIAKELYPFGKRKYQIPAGRKTKKSLLRQELKQLFEYEVIDENINKARAFWFFSYSTNGLNIKDIAELKYQNISRNTISFVRAKTKNTTKSNLIPINASLTPFAKLVIDKYGNPERITDNYVFPILHNAMSAKEKARAVSNFTRFVNQHIKKLATLIGITPDISTYYARHSFTTIAIQNGATLEFIQESLGHADLKTTMNYWGGFSENVKKEISDKIMDFGD